MEKDFAVFMFKLVDNDGPIRGHPTDDATLVIKKNGVEIRLEGEEIESTVFAAGGNFRWEN